MTKRSCFMKKLFFALIIVSNLSLAAFAGYVGQNQVSGGYTGTVQSRFTLAKDVKNLRDNQYITLKGYIISKIGNEKYMFKDESGTVQIEIDDKDWNGCNVGASDRVILEGEVDRDWNSVTVDVNSVRLDTK